MNNLDLDIKNYNIYDIEKFFRLKSNSKYTASDVELKEYQIRDQLLNSGHIDKRFKRELIEFLTTAKQWIISVNCTVDNIANNVPSTIPKNYKLDTIEPKLVNEPPYSRNGDIINRPDVNFVYTDNSQYLPGKMNPINTRTITKCVNIDTRFRDNIYNTSSTDFTVQIPTKFNKVVSMELSALELPISFYGISANNGNNFLYIGVEYTSHNYPDVIINTSKIVIIPDGNYNTNDLLSTINTILCPKDINGGMLDPTNIFSHICLKTNLTVDGSGSGKITIGPINENSPNYITISLDFSRDIIGKQDNIEITRKLGWNLGFIKTMYNGSMCYTSESIIDTKINRYIYLSIEDFNKNANSPFISIFNQSILTDDILARISIKGTHFNLLKDSDMTIISEPRIYFGPVDIQRLRIRLLDEFGKVLDMNHSNYSFCLTLKMMYDA
jgi:hypothetical protein